MSIDSKVRSSTLKRKLRRIGRAEIREEARAFIEQFHRENDLSPQTAKERIREALNDLKKHGYYQHTSDELAFGARVAWRNHARCIGRLHWRSLRVIDCRLITHKDDIAERLVDHISLAQGDGNIQSTISIFAPVLANQLPAFIESRQLIQYAGYARPGQPVLGDPITLETTRTLASLGWKPPSKPSHFDLLPILLRDANGQRQYFELPANLVKQVHLEHPSEPAINALKLQWYVLPCVSSMILTIGGIDYPCAPFNGYYMGTEIASRNLADERRYNLLPTIAQAINNSSSESPVLWKDRALTILNEAVLYSFRRAGIRVVDHHTASNQYMDFHRIEQAHGRQAAGDWSWLVPPQSSSACPVFHLKMENRTEVPNFYSSRAADGNALRVYHDQEEHNKWWFRWDRIKRRYRRWRRTRGK
ncbi:MAG: nitric oxide synthase oxygenase [Methylococcales bacterium]